MNRGHFKVTKVSSSPLDNAADRLAIFFQLHADPQNWRYLYEAPQPLDHKPCHDFIQIVMFFFLVQPQTRHRWSQ